MWKRVLSEDERAAERDLPPDIRVVKGLTGGHSSIVLAAVDVYRHEFFQQPHDIYLGERLEEDASFALVKICCVKRAVCRGLCDVLYLEGGVLRVERVAELLVKDGGAECGWLSLLSPSNRTLLWRYVPEMHASVLRMQLLALEARVGLRRTFSVGVIFGEEGDRTEEEMFKNGTCCKDFFNAIGEEIHESGWGHHYGSNFLASGETNPNRSAYYASFRGYEILFHVAPLLSDTEQRQYIGNDKVLIFCLARDADFFVPGFRGDVNSVGIACRPAVCGWDVNVFCRSRIECFEPVFVGRNLNGEHFRQIVLSLTISGYQAVMLSAPYVGMLSKVMDADFKSFCPPRERPKRGSAIRRVSSFRDSSERSSKEGLSPPTLPSPRGKPLRLLFPPSPVKEDLDDLPFPGVALRKTGGHTPVSGGSSPREKLRHNKSDPSRISKAAAAPPAPVLAESRTKRLSKSFDGNAE